MPRLATVAGALLGPVARFVTARHLRVLVYHRFSARPEPRKLAADALREQLRYLRRHFTPLTLGQVARAAVAGTPLPPRSVVVTVDDGYADFVDVAYPLLVEHRVPATLFVVSTFAEGTEWAWYDKLRYLVYASTAPEVTVELPGKSQRHALASPADRERAWDRIATDCLRLTTVQRTELIRQLAHSLGVALPVRRPSEYAAAGVDRLRALDPEIVDIGGHTATHPILSMCTDDELEAEIVGGRDRLRELLDRPVDFFCYPNGMPGDFDERTKAAVRRAGYVAATVAYGGLCTPARIASDPYAIPRLSVGAGLESVRNELNGATYLRARVTLASARS
jgi:peptidoglycan/xylan/chitin deacetylase (PgdA/CDA1 family)